MQASSYEVVFFARQQLVPVQASCYRVLRHVLPAVHGLQWYVLTSCPS